MTMLHGKFILMAGLALLAVSCSDNDTTVDDIEEAEAAIEAAKSAVGVQPPAAFVTAKKAPNPFLAKLLKKTTGSELIIALGDVVRFTGGAQYTTSTGSTVIKNSAAGACKSNQICKKRPAPLFSRQRRRLDGCRGLGKRIAGYGIRRLLC